jgi:hypothetical protein
LCCLSFHLRFFLMAIVFYVLPFTLLSYGHCLFCPSLDRQYNGHQKEG